MDYVAVLKKRWWIVVAVTVVLTVAVIGLSLAADPRYRASTRLLYQKNNLDVLVTGQAIFSSTNTAREVQSGTLLVGVVADAVIKDLGLTVSRDDLLDRVEAEIFSQTDIIELTAVGDSASQAADIADTLASELVAFRDAIEQSKVASAISLVQGQIDSLSPGDAASAYGAELRARLSGLQILQTQPVSGFRIISKAIPPSAPFSPKVVLNAVRAAILGIILGVGLAFLVHFLFEGARQGAARGQPRGSSEEALSSRSPL